MLTNTEDTMAMTTITEDCGCKKELTGSTMPKDDFFSLSLSFKAPKKDHVLWVNTIAALLKRSNLELDRFESYRY